jgi:hypothetical protein
MKNIKTEGKPEIVIHIEGDENYIVKKTSSGTSVKRQVGDSEAYEDVSSPQSLLNQMFDGKMSNPIKFLDASPKDRVDLMLQAIELPYSFGDLCDRTQLKPEEFAPVPGKIHPMVEIDLHRLHVFNTRTGVNRDQKQKAASADQMFRSVPAETPEAEDIESAREQIETLMIAQSGLESESKAELDAEIERIETKLDGMEKEIRAKLENKSSKTSQTNPPRQHAKKPPQRQRRPTTCNRGSIRYASRFRKWKNAKSRRSKSKPSRFRPANLRTNRRS